MSRSTADCLTEGPQTEEEWRDASGKAASPSPLEHYRFSIPASFPEPRVLPQAPEAWEVPIQVGTYIPKGAESAKSLLHV